MDTMYIVNTSFMVEPAVHERWLAHFRQAYLPLLQAQGFGELTFSRVLSAESVDHFTYSLQVRVAQLDDYNRLVGEFMEEYAALARPLFDEKVLWFSTLMRLEEL